MLRSHGFSSDQLRTVATLRSGPVAIGQPMALKLVVTYSYLVLLMNGDDGSHRGAAAAGAQCARTALVHLCLELALVWAVVRERCVGLVVFGLYGWVLPGGCGRRASSRRTISVGPPLGRRGAVSRACLLSKTGLGPRATRRS